MDHLPDTEPGSTDGRERRDLFEAFLLIALALILAILIGGCAAQQAIERGDQARLAGDYTQALREYEQALRHDASLARKPEFSRTYRELKWRAANEQGWRLIDTQSFEAAVETFSRGLEIKPGHAQMTRGLTRARNGAAAKHHAAAREKADRGDLAGARSSLERSLNFVETQPARAALASLDGARPTGSTRAKLEHAEAAQAQRHWSRAAGHWRDVIGAAPDHLPARAGLHRAESRLAEARRLQEQAVEHRKHKRLDQAISALEEALVVWPVFEQADRLLAETRDIKAHARQLVAAARQAASDERWDQALALVTESLEMAPHDEPTQAYEQQLRATAAAALVADGRALIAAEDFAGARAAFQHAKQFVPRYADARRGLAEIDIARARAAERKGHTGVALLRYLNAHDHDPSSDARARADRLRAALARHADHAMSVQASNAEGDATRESQRLRAAVIVRLRQFEDPHFRALSEGDAPATSSHFAARLTLERVDVDDQPVRRESRSHAYQVLRDVPNPEIPALSARVQQAEIELAHALQRQRARCHRCAGHGHVEVIIDERCILRQCPICHGSGLRHRHALREVRRAEARLHRARADLARAPAVVQQPFTQYWPYTLERHEQVGEMKVAAAIVDPEAPEPPLAAFGVESTKSWSDTTIDRPNPDVGLKADPLALPARDVAIATLRTAAVDKLAARLRSEAARLHSEALLAAAFDRRADGDEPGAIDLHVAAAIALEQTDGPQAAGMILKLRRNLDADPN